MPYTESRFQNRPRTLEYYKNGVKNILAFAPLAGCHLDAVTQGLITAFIAKKREANLQVTSINRQLEVLRRMLKLAAEWNKPRFTRTPRSIRGAVVVELRYRYV